MHFKAHAYRRLALAILFIGLILTGCVTSIEQQTIQMGEAGVPCKLLDGLPPAPEGAQALTDTASLDMVAKLTNAFKTNTQVATVKGQAYLTTQPFSEIKDFYENMLQPGWEYRENIVSLVSQDTASVAAWSSCSDELVAVFFYKDVNSDGNGLIVLYAKP
jgi:nitrous oxide reductase accessory protein NosL